MVAKFTPMAAMALASRVVLAVGRRQGGPPEPLDPTGSLGLGLAKAEAAVESEVELVGSELRLAQESERKALHKWGLRWMT